LLVVVVNRDFFVNFAALNETALPNQQIFANETND